MNPVNTWKVRFETEYDIAWLIVVEAPTIADAISKATAQAAVQKVPVYGDPLVHLVSSTDAEQDGI